ncbi:MAG: hypothetical protein Ct9H300mP1_09500 [Planctomycetaceae bacterium]|nr:MAG: hypothetical protein Ct9H300mP1_09500 [Planctomycetaceae bacterium]
MNATGTPVNEVDHEFYHREVDSFLPDRIFELTRICGVRSVSRGRLPEPPMMWGLTNTTD